MCQPGRPGVVDPCRRRPAGLALLRGLPQHEVHVAALVGRDIDARARHHLVERAARQPAVVRHRGYAEQHVLLGRIGVAGRDQPLDQRLHLGDVLGRARLDGRRQAAERRHVLVEVRVGAFGQLADVDPALGRARVDPVVHVGDVAHIGDGALAVEVAQQPEQHVEHDDRAAHCRYGRSRRPSGRTHTCARARDRAGRIPVFRVSAYRTASSPYDCPGLLARASSGLDWEQRRPQPAFELANNPPANAADCEKAVHGGRYASGLALPSSVSGDSAATILPQHRPGSSRSGRISAGLTQEFEKPMNL